MGAPEGDGCLVRGACLPNGCICPGGGVVCSVRGGDRHPTPEMAAVAVVTRSTGMHSCFSKFFAKNFMKMN